MSKLETGDEDAPQKLSKDRVEELNDIFDELRDIYKSDPQIQSLAKAYIDQVEATPFYLRSKLLQEMRGGFKHIDITPDDDFKPVDRE